MFRTSSILERFIVIEGIDGAGTSTQRSILCRALESKSYRSHETWEPTAGPIGLLIRQALRKEIKLGSATLCRLFAADRAEHCYGADGIQARCERGEYVISDRYVFSSYAYQALSEPLGWIAELNRGFPLPEHLIFVDVDMETSRARRNHRGEAAELFEEDPIQLAVRSNYLAMLDVLRQEQPKVQIHLMDGGDSIEVLAAKIWSVLGFSGA